MVYCKSGNAFGFILWCPGAFASSPGLESFPLGSNGIFHVLIPPPRFTTPTVGPSCATHLMSCLELASLDVVPEILSGSISYTSRRTHMQVEDLLEMIARLRVFKLPNFKARVNLRLDFGGASILMLHTRSWCCKLLPHQGSLLHMWQVCAWSYRKYWSLSAWLRFSTYVMRWLSRFLKRVFIRSRLIAWAYSRVISPSTSGSDLPDPVPLCSSLNPVSARPKWPFQSPHGIRNYDPGILAVTARSW